MTGDLRQQFEIHPRPVPFLDGFYFFAYLCRHSDAK
jgi:hypothetical protein